MDSTVNISALVDLETVASQLGLKHPIDAQRLYAKALIPAHRLPDGQIKIRSEELQSYVRHGMPDLKPRHSVPMDWYDASPMKFSAAQFERRMSGLLESMWPKEVRQIRQQESYIPVDVSPSPEMRRLIDQAVPPNKLYPDAELERFKTQGNLFAAYQVLSLTSNTIQRTATKNRTRLGKLFASAGEFSSFTKAAFKRFEELSFNSRRTYPPHPKDPRGLQRPVQLRLKWSQLNVNRQFVVKKLF